MNSRTRAWKRLGELTGWGREGIDYIYSTTDLINRRIQFVLFENKTAISKNNKVDKLNNKMNLDTSSSDVSVLSEDKCAICYNKFYTYKDISKWNNILTLDCNHTFHHSCIRSMLFLYMNDKCPLCRKVFGYKLSSKKIKQKIKKKILKFLKNECNRIKVSEIMNLAMFLINKDITLGFIDQIINDIMHAPSEIFHEMEYCEIDNEHTYLFSDEFCGGDRSYKNYCGCD